MNSRNIPNYDTFCACNQIDKILSPYEMPDLPDMPKYFKPAENGDYDDILMRQIESGAGVRKILDMPLGSADAELSYFSAYLIPRILMNLQKLEKRGDPVAGMRILVGNRIDEAMHSLGLEKDISTATSGLPASIKTTEDLWKMYKVFFAEGKNLRKGIESKGIKSIARSEKRNEDAKRVKVYSAEFMDTMARSAESAGVDLKSLINKLSGHILDSYGEYEDNAQLIMDKSGYFLSMMRDFFEHENYLEKFKENDNEFFEKFDGLKQKLQSLINVLATESVDDHKEMIRDVIKETLKIIQFLTHFYTKHSIHSGVVMQSDYSLSDEAVSGGVASIKWHLMLAHFILTQRKLLRPM